MAVETLKINKERGRLDQFRKLNILIQGQLISTIIEIDKFLDSEVRAGRAMKNSNPEVYACSQIELSSGESVEVSRHRPPPGGKPSYMTDMPNGGVEYRISRELSQNPSITNRKDLVIRVSPEGKIITEYISEAYGKRENPGYNPDILTVEGIAGFTEIVTSLSNSSS